MATITIDIPDEALATYAAGRGKGDDDQSNADFFQACVLADAQDIIVNKMIADAQAAAPEKVVVPDITSSGN